MDLRIALSSVCVPGVSVASTRVKNADGLSGARVAIGRAVGTPRRRSSLPPRKDKPDIVKIHRQLARQGGGEGLDAAGGHLTARLWSSFGVLPRHSAALGEVPPATPSPDYSPSPEAGVPGRTTSFRFKAAVRNAARSLAPGRTHVQCRCRSPSFKPASMVLFIVATYSVISFCCCETGRSPSAGSPTRRWARADAHDMLFRPSCGSALAGD